jgi:Carboxypeptidase regulatory-like domain
MILKTLTMIHNKLKVMLSRQQLVAVALLATVALAGCGAWGTDSPGTNDTGEPNQSDDLQDEQNQNQDDSTEDNSADEPLGSSGDDGASGDTNPDSDAESPQSSDSDNSGSNSSDDNTGSDTYSNEESHHTLAVSLIDQDGDPITDMPVTVEHIESGESRTLTTDANGEAIVEVVDGDFLVSSAIGSDAGIITDSVTVDRSDTALKLEGHQQEDSSGSDDSDTGNGSEDGGENDSGDRSGDSDNGGDDNGTGDRDEDSSRDGVGNDDQNGSGDGNGDNNGSNGIENGSGDGDNSGDNDTDPEPNESTTLVVTVIDDETGEPIADEEVRAALIGYGLEKTATTDENGIATFNDLPDRSETGADSYNVEFSADVDGYSISEGQTAFTTNVQGGEDNEHTLNLIPDPEIYDVSFDVTDNQTGKAIEGASIHAVGGRYPSGADMLFSGTTDANGEYSTTAAEYERYEVEIRADGYEPLARTIPITSDTSRTFGLTPENPTTDPAPNESNSTDESAAA